MNLTQSVNKRLTRTVNDINELIKNKSYQMLQQDIPMSIAKQSSALNTTLE